MTSIRLQRPWLGAGGGCFPKGTRKCFHVEPILVWEVWEQLEMALKVWNNDSKSQIEVLLKGTCVLTEGRRVSLDWGELEVEIVH